MIAHSRQNIRLKGYDYSRPGAYFITICAHGREILFGEVIEGEMVLNDLGRKVQEVWNALPEHYLQIDLDAFVIMPNHVHGIIFVGAGLKPAHLSPKLEPCHVNPVSNEERTGLKPAPTKRRNVKRPGIPEIVRAFKTFSARSVNQSRQTPGMPLWQRNYYEHIIRNEADLCRIRQYIINNPLQWALDSENPVNY